MQVRMQAQLQRLYQSRKQDMVIRVGNRSKFLMKTEFYAQWMQGVNKRN